MYNRRKTYKNKHDFALYGKSINHENNLLESDQKDLNLYLLLSIIENELVQMMDIVDELDEIYLKQAI